MGTTASVYANRITVCLTARQREFLFAGMRHHQLGLSEYVRRLFDQLMEIDEAAKTWRGPMEKV